MDKTTKSIILNDERYGLPYEDNMRNFDKNKNEEIKISKMKNTLKDNVMKDNFKPIAGYISSLNLRKILPRTPDYQHSRKYDIDSPNITSNFDLFIPIVQDMTKNNIMGK
jgi:hypothetical protein